MRKPFRMIGTFAVLGPLAALGVAAAPMAGAQTHGHGEMFRVVAEHLNNPRGLAPAPHGGLYLARPAPAVITVFPVARRVKAASGGPGRLTW